MFLTLPQICNLYAKHEDEITAYLQRNKCIRENFTKIERENLQPGDTDGGNDIATQNDADVKSVEGVGIGIVVTAIIISLAVFILLVVGLIRGVKRGMPSGWMILAILGFFIPPLQIATIIIVIYYNFIHNPNKSN